MEYKGKLYGKLFNKHFEIGKTTDDWDKLEKENEELKRVVNEYENKLLSCNYCGSTDIRKD